jgi:uncharacterized protein DUF1761
MDASVTFQHLNWLAVIVAAAAPFAIGSLWYGPLFGKAWMKLTGLSKGAPGQNSMGLTFGLTAVLNLIIATSLALFIGGGDWLFGLSAGFAAGFTFVAMALGVIYLFESRPLKLWLVNAGYQTVVFTVMGTILGAWH